MSSRWLALPLVLLAASPVAAATPGGYAVVVKGDTLNKPGWKEVVNALVDKHGAWIATYDKLDEARVILASKMPRYACFVATPEETTRDFLESAAPRSGSRPRGRPDELRGRRGLGKRRPWAEAARTLLSSQIYVCLEVAAG